LALLGQLDAGGVCRQNAELSGCDEVGAGVECGLAWLRSWGRSGFVCWMRWGRFFWFVRWRGDGRRDLRTDFEMRHAGALMLVFVVACGGADVSGWRDVGAAVVAGVGVGIVGVEGSGSVDDAVTVAVGDGVGVPGAGVVDGVVGAAAVGVVECVGIAVDRTRGRRGVSDVENAGSNVVEVEREC